MTELVVNGGYGDGDDQKQGGAGGESDRNDGEDSESSLSRQGEKGPVHQPEGAAAEIRGGKSDHKRDGDQSRFHRQGPAGTEAIEEGWIQRPNFYTIRVRRS